MRTFRRTMVALATIMIAASLVALGYSTQHEAAASVPVQPTDDALQIAQALASDPSVVVGASWVSRPQAVGQESPTGIVTAPITGFPTAGQTAAILTTGDATIIDSVNDSDGSSANQGGLAVRGQSDSDVTILKIDLSVPAGVNCLSSLDFRYLSEEYPKFVNSSFNDAFIAELDPVQPWTTSSSDIFAPDNFAFDPAHSEISINTAGATSMTAGFAAGTTYDGATPLLRAMTPITPGPHSLYLSIFDQVDWIRDSAVVIDNLGFGTVANPPVDCVSGATTPPDEPPTTPPTTPSGGGGPSAPAGASYVPVVPDRILETRSQYGLTGYVGAKPTAGQTISLDVTGVGDAQLPDDTAAVVLNITGTDATADGYVTVWPCGVPRPNASNLNLTAASTSPNLVISKVGVNGTVCLYTQSGAHLLADVTGYFPAGASYVPVVPDRILETRSQYGLTGYVGAKPTAGQTISLDVTGVGDAQLPDDTAAVVLNITGTDATADGYVTVWPCGVPRPNASNLNLTAASTSPNLVISKVGVNGTVCLYTQSGAHLLADVTGYFPAGASYVPVVPDRILETRSQYGLTGYVGAKPTAGQTISLDVTGVGDAQLPDDTAAVVLNITGTDATADGYVTVWPCGVPRPNASNLNLTAASTSPNLVISKVGVNGTVCLYTQSGAHLLADVTGYFPAD